MKNTTSKRTNVNDDILKPLSKRKKRDINADIKMFQQKLESWMFQGKELNLKPGCELKDNTIFMECVNCKQKLHRTTEFFNAQSIMNFEDAEPGHEYLHNSITHPCKSCVNKMETDKRKTTEGFISNLVSHYPMLTKKWFDETLEKQNGKGLITNTILNLTTNASNCAGIHRYDNNLGHTQLNCFLEVQELNVQQQEAIESLILAWIDVFNYVANEFEGNIDDINYLQLFRDQFNKTRKDLGIGLENGRKNYNKQCCTQHFKTLLRQQIRSHIQNDVRAKRFKFPENFTMKDFVDKVYPHAILQLEKQHGYCGLTQHGLTSKQQWNQISLERINNNLPHFTQDGKLPNCMFICRLFNVRRQLSSKMILEYFLTQILVPISDKTRAKAKAILDLS